MESGVRTLYSPITFCFRMSVTVTDYPVLLGLLVLCLHCPDGQEMVVSDGKGYHQGVLVKTSVTM